VVIFKISIGLNFQMVCLVRLQRENIVFGEKTFLIKRECYILGLP